jgi:hypothetical protein
MYTKYCEIDEQGRGRYTLRPSIFTRVAGEQYESVAMSKNKLTDLNDHLFMQLERLGDENLEGEKLETEIKCTHSMAAISQQVVATADLHLKAVRLSVEHGPATKGVLPMIGGKPNPMASVTLSELRCTQLPFARLSALAP